MSIATYLKDFWAPKQISDNQPSICDGCADHGAELIIARMTGFQKGWQRHSELYGANPPSIKKIRYKNRYGG